MEKEKKRMSKKAKIITAVTVVVVILAIFIPLTVWAAPVEGKVTNEHWNSNMEYTSDYAFEIKKDPTRDFKILAIADTQLSDTIENSDPGDPFDEIEILVERDKPDLIVVLGDITWTALTKTSTKKFVKFMDSLDIPWAPIVGNHEDEKEQGYYCAVDKNWVADRFLEAKNCIFKKGPNNIGGVGNYVINITENGKIVKSLIMMDSHAKRQYPEFNNEWYYDYIYDGQMDWYRWVVKGLTKQNNGVIPESMLCIHIPLNEYKDAYDAYIESGKDESFGFFGNKNEDVYCGKINSGMFDVIKEEGSTKYVFAGHDHQNNYSLMYEGIRLTYGTKTGFRCDHAEGQTGGTFITIGENVKAETGCDVKIEHSYIKYDKKNKPIR